MRTQPLGLLDVISGSTAGATIQFNAWYGGQVVAADLPVTQYSFDFDVTRQVIGQMSCTVLDTTGTLSPWTLSDPLSVGGALIQAQFVSNDTIVPLAWNRITRADPDETWYVAGTQFRWVQNSAEIAIQTKDHGATIQGSRFMSAEAPSSTATVFGELRRLTSGITDVIIDPALTDKNVPASVIYRQDRLAAIQDLVGSLADAEYRMTATGQLSVYRVSTTAVWAANGGVEGTFVKLSRSLAIEDFPNAVVSTNTAPDGTALYGVATQATGDGYFGGPHGRWPVFHNANFATNQTAIRADATTYLSNMQRKRTVEIPMRLMFHPCLEVGDYISLSAPILDGSTKSITGRVKTIRFSGTTSAPAFMEIVLQVPADMVQAISVAMHQARLFGQY